MLKDSSGWHCLWARLSDIRLTISRLLVLRPLSSFGWICQWLGGKSCIITKPRQAKTHSSKACALVNMGQPRGGFTAGWMHRSPGHRLDDFGGSVFDVGEESFGSSFKNIQEASTHGRVCVIHTWRCKHTHNRRSTLVKRDFTGQQLWRIYLTYTLHTQEEETSLCHASQSAHNTCQEQRNLLYNPND